MKNTTYILSSILFHTFWMWSVFLMILSIFWILLCCRFSFVEVFANNPNVYVPLKVCLRVSSSSSSKAWFVRHPIYIGVFPPTYSFEYWVNLHSKWYRGEAFSNSKSVILFSIYFSSLIINRDSRFIHYLSLNSNGFLMNKF